MENGKVARATHNVAAWRVWDEARGVQLHDNDDDGKSKENIARNKTSTKGTNPSLIDDLEVVCPIKSPKVHPQRSLNDGFQDDRRGAMPHHLVG